MTACLQFKSASRPIDHILFAVVLAIAGESVQREINAAGSEERIDPADRFFVGEVVTNCWKIDELEPIPFGKRPDMRMAIEDRFDVWMRANDFKEAVGIK